MREQQLVRDDRNRNWYGIKCCTFFIDAPKPHKIYSTQRTNRISKVNKCVLNTMVQGFICSNATTLQGGCITAICSVVQPPASKDMLLEGK